MEKLFQSSDVVVFGDENALVIRLRVVLRVIVVVVCLLLGGTLVGLSGAEAPWAWRAAGLGDQLLAWVGFIFLAVGLLGLVVVAVLALRRPIVVDRPAGLVHYRGRPIPFDEIERIEVTRAELAGQTGVGIVLGTKAEPLPLLPLVLPAHEPALERLCQVMNRMVATEGTAAAGAGGTGEWGRRQMHRVLGVICLTLGISWSTVGFLVAPGVIFSRSGSEHGFLVWPLGLWIAALGVLELCGVPAYRWLSEGPRWRRWLYGGLWMGSYLILSHV